MNQYLVIMTLESDTCFGAGESKNGLVNTEVLLDEKQFPYLLSKTFMGVWRENIQNFILPSLANKNKKNDRYLKIINSFFNDIDKTVNPIWKVNISNFKIDKNISDMFDEESLNHSFEKSKIHRPINKEIWKTIRKSKQDALMRIEQLTRIDDNQVAEDNSLRAVRLIKKGIAFTSLLTIEGDIVKDDIDFLNKSLKVVKHIGTGKTRGMGRVRIELREFKRKEVRINLNINDCSKKIIRYEFEIKEPVKISKNEEQYDYAPTHKYIPGGTMRGAFLGKWLSQNKEKAMTYIQKIKYHNSYPVYIEDGKRYYTIPMPNIYRNDKQKGRDFNPENDKWEHKYNCKTSDKYIYETIFDGYETDILYKKSTEPNLIYRYKPAPFCFAKGESIIAFDIETKQLFHHTHQKSHENIYRYEAISPKYTYYSFIDLKELEKDNIEELLSQIIDSPDLWVGGSKKSGYGRIEIKKIDRYYSMEEALEEMNIIDKSNGTKPNDMWFFYSDFVGDIPNIKNLGLTKKDISFTLSKTTGYNTHWNARTPSLEKIEKGSVIFSKKENISELFRNECCLIEEGFGVILKNLKIFNLTSIEVLPKNKFSESNNISVYSQKISQNEYHNLGKSMIESFIKRRINSFITPAIEDGSFNEHVKKIKNILGENFKTTANGLIQILDSQNLSDEIDLWIENMEKISLNREQVIINSQFLNFEIFGSSIEEWINSEIKNLENNKHDIAIFFDELNHQTSAISSCIIKDKYKLEQNKIQRDVLRQILYYAVQSYS